MSAEPLVSVIVTSYNQSNTRNMLTLIDSFRRQNYRQLELIVVIENSENLYKVVSEYVKQTEQGNIRCFLTESGGASPSRNFAVTQANGAILAFVDDDVVLPIEWASELSRTFRKHPFCIGVLGPVRPLWENQSMSWLPEELEWLVSCTGWMQMVGIFPIKGHTWTSNAAFKREAFRDGIAFNERLGPARGIPGWKRGKISEDVELSMRIQSASGKPVLYNSSLGVWKKVGKSTLAWQRIKDCAFGIGISRVTRQQISSKGDESGRLSLEANLFGRIIFRLMPSIMRDIGTNRRDALRRLFATIFALLFLGLGFAYGCTFSVFKRLDLSDWGF